MKSIQDETPVVSPADRKLILNVTNDYPIFVYGHGWSSVNPDLTCKQQELLCRQLQAEDICLVLTYCVNSTGKKNRMASSKSCSYKMPSLTDHDLTKCGLQPSLKSVKTGCTGYKSDPKKKTNNDILSESVDRWTVPVSLKSDPHHSSPPSLFSPKNEMKGTHYVCDAPVIKQPKLEIPFHRTLKSSSSISHPFSACNLAKSPDNI
ncbi:unnamed protein product [Heterobilharzia americana]|nr:unnamed protein product [Heterobilharzia americana]